MKYVKVMEAKRIIEEAVRKKENARKMAAQHKRDRLALEKKEKELAHKRWLAEKNGKLRQKLGEEKREAKRKEAEEGAIRRERERNIEIYRKRLAKREREKKRRMKKAQKALAEGGEDGPADSGGMLPKLAMALGKPLSSNFTAGPPTATKKKGKANLYKQKMKGKYAIPDYKESLKESEMARKALMGNMKMKMCKKSPKRKKQDREGGNGLPPVKKGITGHDRNKFFLSNKERNTLNMLDSSPVAPNMGETPINDWAVR